MAKQQDSSRVSSTDMSLTTKIQKARKVLESVQEVNLLPICNIVNVSKEIQEKFCNEFKKHKPLAYNKLKNSLIRRKLN